MSVAVTFCCQTEHERRENEHGYSSFHRSEAESLPHFNEFKTPVPFNHEGTENFASIRGLALSGLVRKRVPSPALAAFAVVGSESTDNGP
jgi:hypothetical protein